MSFKALAWAFDQELKTPEKSVLVALAYRDNHDEPHGCFPSIPRIAKDCGMSERTVQRCLRRLERIGKISTQKRKYRSTFYFMPLAWVVSDSHHPGVTQSPPLVSHSHPEPKDLTGMEPKPRPHKPRTSNLPLEEKIRRVQMRDERLTRDAEVRMELNVGSGPELVRSRPADMSVQELAKCIGALRSDRKAMA